MVFFNVNISVTIKIRHFIFLLIIIDTIREGIVSQIFYFICLIFILCNVEHIVENYVKKFPFFVIK